MNVTSTSKHCLGLTLAIVALLGSDSPFADNLVGKSRNALQQLVAQNPAAAKCKSKALAILVFPKVVKAGFVIGTQTGEGVLFVVYKCARAVATGLCAVPERPAP
jgi:lipid-binding SYLF domain-containing protein